jgi:hypothetical protein
MKEVSTKKATIQCRLYRNPGDRRRAIANLKRIGYNYFVGYDNHNVKNPLGLSFGHAEWAGLFPFEKM